MRCNFCNSPTTRRLNTCGFRCLAHHSHGDGVYDCTEATLEALHVFDSQKTMEDSDSLSSDSQEVSFINFYDRVHCEFILFVSSYYLWAHMPAHISTYLLQTTLTGMKRLVMHVNVLVHNGLVHTIARTCCKKTYHK